jgi:hypothetical protein
MIGKDLNQHQNILSRITKTFIENRMKQLMTIGEEKENHVFCLKMEYQEKKFKEELAGFTKQLQHITNIDTFTHYIQDQVQIH